MRLAVAALVMSLGMTSVASASEGVQDLPLLPMPATVSIHRGAFSFAHASIRAEDAGERLAAGRLLSLLAKGTGPRLSGRGQIRFHRDGTILGSEAYRIRVEPHFVEVSAGHDAGLYYGAQTLWQLMASAGPSKQIPAMEIEDSPAFSWRGVMLDSSRHMQPVAYIEQLIDRMALVKLNTLHWHLTDDQGWRIQIDHYPQLMSVAAWRQDAGAAGLDPTTGRPIFYGGFYSKAEIRKVVAFARTRHVTIVPEIDVPGHATAIIAAYPNLASTPKPPSAPSHDWGILPNLLSPADRTFTFLDNVLDEVMPLFPGAFIHMGGDEAVKDQWKSDPFAQAKIRALRLKDEDALQGWFTARVGAYLHQHGKRLIGWDEIMQGEIPADAAITSWHGVDGAIAAAKAGHDAVLAPAPDLYLDNRQSDSGDEPPGRGEIVSWKRLYDFNPSPPSLTPEQRRHILGLQVNLWTEHVRTTDYADRMIWPRAAVLAELAWSNPAKDWPRFAQRLVAAMDRWRALGLRFDEVPLEPQAKYVADHGPLRVELRQPANIGAVHYALEGAGLSFASPLYNGPLSITAGTRLSARSFLGTTPLGSVKQWIIRPELARTQTASEMELCSSAIPLRLEDDGPTRGVRIVHWVDIAHPCWIWRSAPLDLAKSIVAEVGRLPFNFAIGDDIKKITFRPPATAAGELQVRRDGCDGPLIASIPLQFATRTSGDAQVQGPIHEVSGSHDLCMTFTQRDLDPFWVLDRLTLQ